MRVKKRPLRRFARIPLLILLVLAVVLTTSMLVHARDNQPPTPLNVSRTGLTATSSTPPADSNSAVTGSPTPKPNPTPTATAATAPTPSPKAAAAPATSAAHVSQVVSAAPTDCAALQTQWQQSWAGTMADATQQLNRTLSNLLLSLGLQNAGIDSYNKMVQSAYNSLTAQAKSAQCSLSLSAPQLYPHER